MAAAALSRQVRQLPRQAGELAGAAARTCQAAAELLAAARLSAMWPEPSRSAWPAFRAIGKVALNPGGDHRSAACLTTSGTGAAGKAVVRQLAESRLSTTKFPVP